MPLAAAISEILVKMPLKIVAAITYRSFDSKGHEPHDQPMERRLVPGLLNQSGAAAPGWRHEDLSPRLSG